MGSTHQHHLKLLTSYIANPNPSTFFHPTIEKLALLQFKIIQMTPFSQSTITVLMTTHFLHIPFSALKFPKSQELYCLISESLMNFDMDPYLCKEYVIPRVFNQAVRNMAGNGKLVGFLRMLFEILILNGGRFADERDEQELKEKEIPTCPVCWDEMLLNSMFSCSCGH